MTIEAMETFPSPFGVRVLKFFLPFSLSLQGMHLFPSPFGVRVLKCAASELRYI